mgnify:CR=1 FL=1|jgi:hypothetical protein
MALKNVMSFSICDLINVFQYQIFLYQLNDFIARFFIIFAF